MDQQDASTPTTTDTAATTAAKKMIVIGCGRLGAELAYGLYRRGHDVTVIDRSAAAFANLPDDFRGRTMEGDVLEKDLLDRAGLEGAEGVASVTSSDSVNALVGHLARKTFAVPYVVVRNYNPRWLSLLQDFGLQVISSSIWGAQRMEELLDGVMHTVFSAGNGEIEIYEFTVPEGWARHGVADLPQSDEWRPVSVTRAGRAMLMGRDAVFAAGDVLHMAATRAGAELLRDAFGPAPNQEEG